MRPPEARSPPSPRDLALKAILLEGRPREDFLRQACDGDGSLLEKARRWLALADDSPLLSRPAFRLLAPPASPPAAPGDRLGAYRVVSEIGVGGMGVVYRAERADGSFEKQVAIKFLQPRLETRALSLRFRQESQILARLDHPAIARLLDAGRSGSGRPYIILECVEGEPISDYCARLDLGPKARIRLFLRVCRGVSFAHRNLVIHCDIKPSHILVDEDGMPKILDFGIARLAASGSSGSGDGLGRHLTPRYASPEQASGGTVSTSTDVYSLGVVLYRLLVGHSPYSKATSREALLADVAEGRTIEPRRLAPRLPQEIACVLHRALEKEPANRYPSVDALASDLERYLAVRPVQACGDGRAYRARTWFRRNPVTAALAGALVVTGTLLGGLNFAQLQRTRAERDATRIAHRQADDLAGFLQGVFENADPGSGGAVSATELLDAAAERIEQELPGQPERQARFVNALVSSYVGLGSYDRALAVARETLARLPDLPAVRWRLFEALGAAEGARGELQPAVEHFAEALAALAGDPAANAADRADVEAEIATCLIYLSRFDEAEPHLQRAEDLLASWQDPLRLAAVRSTRAGLYHKTGRYAQAAALYEEILRLRRQHIESPHEKIALAHHNLAWSQTYAGKLEQAESHYREAIAMRVELFGARHPAVARSRFNLGQLYWRQARGSEAEHQFEAAASIFEEAFSPASPWTFAALRRLSEIVFSHGDVEEARRLANLCLERSLEHRMEGQEMRARNLLATLAHDAGSLAEADAGFQRALALSRKLHGAEHPHTGRQLNNLALVYQDQGRLTAARELLERSLELAVTECGDRLRAGLNLLFLDLLEARLEAVSSRLEAIDAACPEPHDRWGRRLALIRLGLRAAVADSVPVRELEAAYSELSAGAGGRRFARLMAKILETRGQLDEARSWSERPLRSDFQPK